MSGFNGTATAGAYVVEDILGTFLMSGSNAPATVPATAGAYFVGFKSFLCVASKSIGFVAEAHL